MIPPPKNTCTPTLHKSHKIFDIRLMYNQPFNIGSNWCTAYLTTNGASDVRPILQQRERVMYDLSYDRERPILRQRTTYLTTKGASDVRPILRQRERLMYDLFYNKGSEWCTYYLTTKGASDVRPILRQRTTYLTTKGAIDVRSVIL